MSFFEKPPIQSNNDSGETEKQQPLEVSENTKELAKFFPKIPIQIGPFVVNIKSNAVSRFFVWAQKNLQCEQHKQQEKVEEYFKSNSTIEVHSMYRNPDGSGILNLTEELKNAGTDSNKIVLLLNGIVNPQDVIQANPKLARVVMAALRLHTKNIARYGFNAKKILTGDTIAEYITNTVENVQRQLFKNEHCKVFIVRNATAEDLDGTIKVGGEQTVLVVGGHGDFGSVSMTDKTVLGSEIDKPTHKLKAFVQHTCAGRSKVEQEEIGKRFAQQTFGWTHSTSPLDFIEEPLKPRSDWRTSTQ